MKSKAKRNKLRKNVKWKIVSKGEGRRKIEYEWKTLKIHTNWKCILKPLKTQLILLILVKTIMKIEIL